MDSNMKLVEPLSSSELVMRDLGRRYSQGVTLSLAEQNMAMMASAALLADRYGPSPATMKLKGMDLPETVKGALASYTT